MAAWNTQELDALLAEIEQKRARISHEIAAESAITCAEEDPPEGEDALPIQNPPTTERPAPESIPDCAPLPIPTAPHQLRYTLLGLFLVLFAAIGVFTVGAWGVRLAQRARPVDRRIAEVTNTILPLVVMDCPTFDAESPLPETQLLTAAIWSLMMQDGLANYPELLGMCTVPAADVTAAAQRLFANLAEMPSHRTVGATNDLRCYYDAEADCYFIPTDVTHFSYTPDIRSLTEVGDTLIAEAAYIPDLPTWQQTNHAPEPTKIMRFTLKQGADGSWQIVALEQIT